MYWSIYDVLMLVSGLITLVIVIAPVKGITPRTRITAGAIGGVLVFASLLLASIPFFRYPGIVVVAPAIALLSAIAVIGKAVRAQSSLQIGQQGHTLHHQEPDPMSGPAHPQVEADVQSISADLTPAELMELAARDRTKWVEIAQHPSAYPDLLEWLNQYGSADVKAAVAARRHVDAPDPA
ncbi:hypothetical protein ACFVVC_04645 [Pseudarthrobacter sp. NPDC058196]|uniref:variant leucine-rich repeat-containing protein n=1 Tax=Pseudarthrobacter sp. NPDC058196 TaxID=3346376 RepID=UPI0036DD054C